MFETSKPVPHAFCGESLPRDSSADGAYSDAISGGDALRAIEWRELAARLNAARELRRELRQEAVLCAGTSGAFLGDAAARFFNFQDNGERPVNPDALEGCKASCDTSPAAAGTAAGSDARDDL